MSRNTGAYGLSALIHAAIVALVVLAGVYMSPELRPVVIDFSLQTGYGEEVDERAAVPPEPEPEPEEPESEPPPPEPEPEPVVETPPPPVTQVKDVEAVPIDVPEEPAPEPEQVSDVKPRLKVPRLERPAPRKYVKSGPPGPPGPLVDPAEEYMKVNFSYIRDYVQKNVEYPVLARKFGWEGSVKVSFLVHLDGSISELKVAASSGRKVLDTSAMNAVRMAAPFPPPPVMAELVIPVVYRLQ